MSVDDEEMQAEGLNAEQDALADEVQRVYQEAIACGFTHDEAIERINLGGVDNPQLYIERSDDEN